jgi:acetoin:2,6-dichlorophenolindophenol oxidoreductase subunit alpha
VQSLGELRLERTLLGLKQLSAEHVTARTQIKASRYDVDASGSCIRTPMVFQKFLADSRNINTVTKRYEMQLSRQSLLESYRRMSRIRKFEERVTLLVRAGKVPGGHTSIGQEAAIVGACMALRDDDYITGTHRSHGHPIGKGARLGPLMAELCGKVSGICKGRGGSMHLADREVGIIGESAIVGGGIPLATGAGLSIQVRGTDQVSLCFFGDGAANQGTFSECLNLAAIWKLPVIFFCENNLYAVSTSVAKSHGQPDIAKRAEGYGIPGVIVDGQDVVAVHGVADAAVKRARGGQGPTLIEAKTYRFDEHCFDLHISVPYRTADELSHYKTQRDPLVLCRAAMVTSGIAEEEMSQVEREVLAEVTEAAAFAESSAFPNPTDVFDYMFSNPIHYPPKATA